MIRLQNSILGVWLSLGCQKFGIATIIGYASFRSKSVTDKPGPEKLMSDRGLPPLDHVLVFYGKSTEPLVCILPRIASGDSRQDARRLGSHN